MIALARRGRDEGSVVMAMLAILVMTGIVSVGLAMVIGSHLAARHDVAFESALAGAERGLNEMVAEVKATPTQASFSPVNGTTSQGVTYTATAASAGSGSWTVDATGTATSGRQTVTRHIQATVTVGTVPPLFGYSALNLGTGDSSNSAIDRYDSSVSSNVCQHDGSTRTPMGTADPRMCTHANPTWGMAVTDGKLTLRSSNLSSYMSEADIYNMPVAGYTDKDAIGACSGDSDVCPGMVGSHVFEYTGVASFPDATICANGIGGGVTAYDGSSALATNAVYNFTNVTLGATTIANLGNVPGSQIVICFNGTLTVSPTVPINASVDGSSTVLTDPTSFTGVTNINPRPPSTLLLISTAGSGSTPVVTFGDGTQSETSISAVIYAPDADCGTSGHVDVYGLLVCHSVSAPLGLDVHYDTQVGNLDFDRPVTVSHWREL